VTIIFWYKHISIEVIENNRGALRVSALSIAKKTDRFFKNPVFAYD